MGISNYPKNVFNCRPSYPLDRFLLALLIRKAINQEINFIAKKELFIFPLDYILRYLGGVPVNRNSKSKTVDLIAENFHKKRNLY